MKTICRTDNNGKMRYTQDDLTIEIKNKKVTFYIDENAISTFDCDNSSTLDYCSVGTPFYLLKCRHTIIFITNNNQNFAAKVLGDCNLFILSSDELILKYSNGSSYIINRSSGILTENLGIINIIYYDNIVTIYTKENNKTLVYYLNTRKTFTIPEIVQAVIICEFKYLLKILNDTYVKINKTGV